METDFTSTATEQAQYKTSLKLTPVYNEFHRWRIQQVRGSTKHETP